MSVFRIESIHPSTCWPGNICRIIEGKFWVILHEKLFHARFNKLGSYYKIYFLIFYIVFYGRNELIFCEVRCLRYFFLSSPQLNNVKLSNFVGTFPMMIYWTMQANKIYNSFTQVLMTQILRIWNRNQKGTKVDATQTAS